MSLRYSLYIRSGLVSMSSFISRYRTFVLPYSAEFEAGMGSPENFQTILGAINQPFHVGFCIFFCIIVKTYSVFFNWKKI